MVKTWTYKELEEKYGKLCKRYKQVCYDKKRLEAQLDREIHINRIMKSALEKYANSGYWFVSSEFDGDCVFLHPDSNGYELAKQVLKEIDNKE